MQAIPFARFALTGALILALTACGGSGEAGDAGPAGSDPAGGQYTSEVAGWRASPDADGGVYWVDPSTGSAGGATEATGHDALTTGASVEPGAPQQPAAEKPPVVEAGPVVTTDDPPTEPPVAYARKVPMKGPVLVPATFTGLHSHRWPGGSASAPTYGYGTVRSLNYDPADTLGVHWYAINKADNVYDWSKMDQWVNTHYAAGKQLMYTFYGTPAWCASNMSQRDPYNRYGGDSAPSSLSCVQKYIDALVRRYNGDGVRRLHYIEIWNEPTFGGISYWRGSATQLAQLGRTVYQTAKAIDPGIKVLWPSFVEWYSGVQVWADNIEYGNASDGAGGTGKDWADGFAFHYYSYSTNMTSLMDNQESVRKTMQALGKSWDTYNTEMGFGDGYAATLSTDVKATLIRRWMALSAAYGNKVAILYSHDGSNLGSPATNPAIAAAANDAHVRLAGKTIREAGVLTDGRVFVVFGDNSTWII